MRSVDCAVIAAAGLGSRLGHGLPKCMLEIGGKPLLSRLVETLEPLVTRIHVVVGYREEMVINLCANLHRNVVIVRNPDYRTTNTAQSNALGAKGCSGKVLFLDGDLVIKPSSMNQFIDRAAENVITVGVTRTHSEMPVYAQIDSFSEVSRSQLMIQSFSREQRSEWEWANVVAGPADLMNFSERYVFESLTNMLPLPASEIELKEIDTPKDFESAKAFITSVSSETRQG